MTRSGIVGSCRELSGIVGSCRELSGIVGNCRELSGVAGNCRELPGMVIESGMMMAWQRQQWQSGSGRGEDGSSGDAGNSSGEHDSDERNNDGGDGLAQEHGRWHKKSFSLITKNNRWFKFTYYSIWFANKN
jgi:hypothetical protein